MKSSRLVVALLAVAAFSAIGATQDIAVTAAGDQVYWHQWYRGGSDRGWAVDANPNVVSHTYYDGSGSTNETVLNFDLTSALGIPPGDINSVSFNFNILDIWTESGLDGVVGNLSGVDGSGAVLLSGGAGPKFFDVTSAIKTALGSSATSASFSFGYTGYTGFTFSSAEGGNPAFLRIESVGAVPEPETFALMLAGLGVISTLVSRRMR